MTRLGRRTILAGSAALLSSRASAQTYPDRPIRLVVPAGAGGPTDVVARILQPHLSQILGQSVVKATNFPRAAKTTADGFPEALRQFRDVI